MRTIITVAVALISFSLLGLVPSTALAGCGAMMAFVEPSKPKPNTPLYSDAVEIVVSRFGNRSVTTMQNSYAGPLEDFAVVVAVPRALGPEDVRTLRHDALDVIRAETAPVLIERWEDSGEHRRVKTSAGGSTAGFSLPVTVESEFNVGEYEVRVLSATDSSKLVSWLGERNIRLPQGGEAALQPYIENGSYFFVAKVDIKKVKFEKGRALLSPIQFRYESDDFILPIRLGMLNNRGNQDLIVYVIGDSRYEVSNRRNVAIPSNIEVNADLKNKMAQVYEGLFREAVSDEPNTVVTEYANSAPYSQAALFNWPEGQTRVSVDIFTGWNPTPNDEATVLAHKNEIESLLSTCPPFGSRTTQLTLQIIDTGDKKSFIAPHGQFERSEGAFCVLETFQAVFDDETFERTPVVEVTFYEPPIGFGNADPILTRLHMRPSPDTDSDLILKKVLGLGFSGKTGRIRDNLQLNNFRAQYIITHDEEVPGGRVKITQIAPATNKPVAPLYLSPWSGCVSTQSSFLPAMFVLVGGALFRRRRRVE